MNWRWKRLLPFTVLVLILAITLSACGGTAAEEEIATDTPEAVASEPTEIPTEEPTEVPMAEPAVTVEDQPLGDDDTVTVPAVTAAEDGWIVIHADADGGPGPVVGQAAVTAGENEDVAVEIDTETATETLYAMLHVDAGEAGTYEFPGADGPVQDADGNVVVRPFTVEGLAMIEPTVTVEDQPLGDDDTVTVPAVTAAEDGWIVIHADADGGPGPVVGQAAVTAGENEDVTVEIDTETATETLYAMLHVDAGEAGTYEFPGADGPVQDAEGNVVVRPFQVSDLAMAEAGEATLTVRTDEELGMYLADGEGLSLYLFEADEPGAEMSTCYDQCAEAWPPVTTTGEVSVGDPAVDEALIDTFEREDGTTHVTYNGWPLYYFVRDEQPGDVTGQGVVGFGAAWYLVTPEGDSVEADAASAESETEETDAGGLYGGPSSGTGDEETDAESTEGETLTVSAIDSAFEPAQLTVSVGSTVVWTNNGNFPHTVTADDGTFDSGTMDSGDTFEFTFDTPGEYPYYCAFHGGAGGAGMSGTIIVEE